MSRRRIHQDGPSLAATEAANSDAEMIAKVHLFIAFHLAKEAEVLPLADKHFAEWTAEDRALDAAASPEATGYHEDLGAISLWEPATLAGLSAKALAVLWTHRGPGHTAECLAWNAAVDLLRLQGEALPEWAVEAMEESAAA